MEKNAEANPDDSVNEPFKDAYCKDVTLVLTKNATEHSTTIKVTEDLERERLAMEHADIDKKISTILKRIETSQREAHDLDRQVYKATELKNYEMTCFERTGEIVNVLKDATEKIKNQAQKSEERRMQINAKVEQLTAEKSKTERFKNNIESLESDIRNILTAPEPLPDQCLISNNKELKKKLEEATENLKIKRLKKIQNDNIKEEKLKILLLINEKQEENKIFENEVGKKKAFLKDLEEKMQTKLTIFQDRLNKSAEKRNELQEIIEKHLQTNQETLKNIEQVKQIIDEKEEALEDLKKKIASRQTYIKEENVKRESELADEKQKLIIAEQQLQSSLTDCERYKQALSEKTSHLSDLKDHSCELIVKLCDSKNKLVVQQHQNADQQSKVDILANKLEIEMGHLSAAKAKSLQLDEKKAHLTRRLEQLPVEQAHALEKMACNHKEKIEGFLKQQNFEKATIELLQLRLEGETKKVGQLRKEVQEFDDTIKWDQMKYEMRKKTADKLLAIAIKEQTLNEKLEAELKKKEEGKKQRQKPPEVEKKDEICLVEDEEKTSQSGRKSPGILKSPFKNQDKSNKRVTFQGLSSTESSSVEDGPLDELLRNWAGANYTGSARKQPMDF